MSNKGSRITEAEWKVMKLLWEKAPQPAYDLAQELGLSEGWQSKTVKTLLTRLVKKGALKFEKYKNLYLYQPSITEKESILQEGESFLNRVFDGSGAKLMLHFAEHELLTKKEADALKRILKNKEKGSK